MALEEAPAIGYVGQNNPVSPNNYIAAPRQNPSHLDDSISASSFGTTVKQTPTHTTEARTGLVLRFPRI